MPQDQDLYKRPETLPPKPELQLRQVLDKMLEGVQIIGFDWRYLYVNDSMTRHGKYTREELIGFTVMEKYPGIEETEIFEIYNRCFNERIPIHLENRFVFPDRSVGWFELSFQPVDEGIFILSIDITERKLNEEKVRQLNEELELKIKERTFQLEENVRQLRESEVKFQKAFEASGAGIAITQLATGKYINVNEAFVQLTGFSAEEIVGRNSVELGMIADVEGRMKVLKTVKEKGTARNFELTIRQKSGRIVEVLSSAEVIVLNGEQFAINIIYDITERKKTEQRLAAVNKELEAFSYTVSHDLKAPLRAINGYAKILCNEFAPILNEEGNRLLEVIQNKARKMSLLIDGLLSFSKLGDITIQETLLDMNEMVGEVINDFERVKVNKAMIKVSKLPPVSGDFMLIGQVWLNLIGNAIKYTSEKQNPVVEIYAKEGKGEITYFVKDNGDGFEMKYAHKLFGVFQRLHSQEEFEGTGVGLAIVNRIITRHGGTVGVTAEPGVGATFSFTLPVR